ncbi:MAG: right-handed parallel beta-helix repeat-containing protein, partial [Candidatus Pacearchaeota archaeon]|nr:right-handed parallel beta-helix repeat-containing protein [Candidatus Pacearchaeota archaeon]
MEKEVIRKIAIVFLLTALVIVLIFISLKPYFTGKAIFFEKETFTVNEPIKGTFDLKLHEGELIPSTTQIIITLSKNDKKVIKELSLKEFVELNNLELTERLGTFFLKGKTLEGEGFGYGFASHYVIYPDVYFQLKIIETKIFETEASEKITSITSLEENRTEKNESKESPTKQPVEEIEEQSQEESTEELEKGMQEQKKKQTLEEKFVKEREEQNPISITTSAIFKAIKIFGIWNSFAILEENPNYKIIEASCSNNEPFIYNLKENEQASLVPGTVRTKDKNLKDSDVNLKIEENKVEVSTDYFESFEGFGEAYLNEKEHKLSFDLSKLDLSADEPGNYILTVSLVYQDQELFKESKEIEIVPGVITVKVLDKEGNVEDEISVNDTKFKLKINKVRVGKEIEHELEIENHEASITGGAIIEQPLPESEISFISMPENVVIQIDKANYDTEVFAIEPSEEIEIERATITLEKTTTQPIARILECESWNIEEFKCNGKWKDSGLEFLDNGTHVSFTTDHFTAYIGESNMTCPYYINEDTYLVSNVSCNGTAFIFNANDVFLDCQGHTINYGLADFGYGVENNGFDNVIIKNCVIVGGNYANADIYQTSYADNFTIMNNTLYFDLRLLESHNSLIYNNTLYGKIYVEAGSNNVFESNLFYENKHHYFRGNYYKITNNNFYSSLIELDTHHTFFAYNYIEDSISEWQNGVIYSRGDWGDWRNNNTIFNNTIIAHADTDIALYIRYNNMLNISNNNITTDCNSCKGIVAESLRTAYIENNDIETLGKDSPGLSLFYLYSDDFRYITNNTIITRGTKASGIYLYDTQNWNGPDRNVFRNNIITTEKGYGFEMVGDCNDPYSTYPSDIDTSNLVEGKPVYYYCDVSNIEISGLDAGQIIVGRTATWPDLSNLTLRNVTSEDGIMLIDGVEGVNITESTINTNNQESVAAIYIRDAPGTKIYDNNLKENYYGVYIKYGFNSKIYNNTVTSNYYGVYDNYGHSHVHDNNISNNEYGIVEKQAFQSQLYSNVMDSNTIAILLNSTPEGGGSYHNVSFNNISRGDYGIYLSDEDNNIIEGNNLDNVDYAIYIYGTSSEQTGNNQILNNNITNSNIYDFYTKYLSIPAFGNDTITNLKTDNVVSSLLALNIALKRTTSPAPDPSGWKNIGKFLDINNITGESCIGEALDCSSFNETECETQFGCYLWEGLCYGWHHLCFTYNESYCGTQKNCYWGSTSWILLNISYLESELGSVNESTLRLWKYNGFWHQIPSDVDTENNIVYTPEPVTNLSIFAPMGEKSGEVACGCDNGTYNYSCGETVYESCIMNCNLDSNGTCFTVGANDIIIDGNGYTINYSNSEEGYGIDNSGGFDNITIKNCTIIQGNQNIQGF